MSAFAVVTGASSGIGRATAIALAGAGFDLALVGRRASALEMLVEELRNEVAAWPFVVDVTDASACVALAESVCEKHGGGPIRLVNCAGMAEFGAFHEIPIEGIERQIRVNLVGTLNMCRGFIPHMLEDGGQIINVGSMAAVNTLAGSVAYTASKAGLHAATKVMAAEYRTRGIRFTSLLPGAVDTPLWDAMDFQPDRAEMIPSQAVAEAIRDLLLMPPDRNVDEMLLMPPKGIL